MLDILDQHTDRPVRIGDKFHTPGILILLHRNLDLDPRCVEFITNPDGTVSVLIKNIEHLEAKL